MILRVKNETFSHQTFEEMIPRLIQSMVNFLTFLWDFKETEKLSLEVFMLKCEVIPFFDFKGITLFIMLSAREIKTLSIKLVAEFLLKILGIQPNSFSNDHPFILLLGQIVPNGSFEMGFNQIK